MRPSEGDLMFYDSQFEQRALVELKAPSDFFLSEDGVLSILTRELRRLSRQGTPWYHYARRYFSALRRVDFYLLKLKYPDHRWLLVARDDLPELFFTIDEQSLMSKKYLRWRPPVDFLADRVIACNPVQVRQFGDRVNDILERHYAGKMTTQVVRPFLLSPQTVSKAGPERETIRPSSASGATMGEHSNSDRTLKQDRLPHSMYEMAELQRQCQMMYV